MTVALAGYEPKGRGAPLDVGMVIIPGMRQPWLRLSDGIVLGIRVRLARAEMDNPQRRANPAAGNSRFYGMLSVQRLDGSGVSCLVQHHFTLRRLWSRVARGLGGRFAKHTHLDAFMAGASVC